MSAANLTPEYLRSILDYDPETGIFTWREKICLKVVVGRVAGSLTANGYIEVAFNGMRLYGHRIAWFYMTGAWPTSQVDHRNRVRSDNRWANLRASTPTLNAQNRGPDSRKSLYGMGVYLDKRNGKFRADIHVLGKRVRLGAFVTAQQAADAYLEAKRRLHEGCTI